MTTNYKEEVLKVYHDAYIKSWFDDNGEWAYCVMLRKKCLGSDSKFLDSAWKSAYNNIKNQKI